MSQGDDTGDDDEDQSEHLNEGEGDLSARGRAHTPAVDRHDERYTEKKSLEIIVSHYMDA